jgi:predicted ribosome quality control (RQC) complex YloA/Tae2 family protein
MTKEFRVCGCQVIIYDSGTIQIGGKNAAQNKLIHKYLQDEGFIECSNQPIEKPQPAY